MDNSHFPHSGKCSNKISIATKIAPCYNCELKNTSQIYIFYTGFIMSDISITRVIAQKTALMDAKGGFLNQASSRFINLGTAISSPIDAATYLVMATLKAPFSPVGTLCAMIKKKKTIIPTIGDVLADLCQVIKFIALTILAPLVGVVSPQFMYNKFFPHGHNRTSTLVNPPAKPQDNQNVIDPTTSPIKTEKPKDLKGDLHRIKNLLEKEMNKPTDNPLISGRIKRFINEVHEALTDYVDYGDDVEFHDFDHHKVYFNICEELNTFLENFKKDAEAQNALIEIIDGMISQLKSPEAKPVDNEDAQKTKEEKEAAKLLETQEKIKNELIKEKQDWLDNLPAFDVLNTQLNAKLGIKRELFDTIRELHEIKRRYTTLASGSDLETVIEHFGEFLTNISTTESMEKLNELKATRTFWEQNFIWHFPTGVDQKSKMA